MSLIACFLAVLPLGSLLGAVGTLRVSDTSSAYVRSRVTDRGAELDLDTVPRVDLGLAWRRAQLTLQYSPRLSARSVAGQDQKELLALHQAEGVLAMSGRRYQLSIGQSVAMGRINVGSLPRTDAPDPTAPPSTTTSGVGLLPVVASLRVSSEQTSVTGTYLWTRRIRSELRGSYGILGGARAVDRLLLPRQRVGTVSGALSYRLTPRQALSTSISGMHVATSNDYEHWIGTLAGEWTTSWTRATSTTLSAGVIANESREPDSTRTTGVLPTGSASVLHAIPRARVRTLLQLGGSVAPTVNTLTGELLTAAQGSASASLQRRRSVLTASIDALQTLPTSSERAIRVVGARLQLTQGFTDWLGGLVGARAQRQELSSSAALSIPWHWVAYAGLSVQTPDVRF